MSNEHEWWASAPKWGGVHYLVELLREVDLID